MSRIERALKKRFESLEGLSAVTPGVVVDVHLKGKRVALLRQGETYTYYDLASLTKILFTASASMFHFDRHRRELFDPVANLLPWWRHKTTPFDFLTHTAGLEWWLPMYEKLKGPMTPESRWAQMKKRLRAVKPARREKAIYSDLDLWMMGAFLEARLEKTLLGIWKDTSDRLDLGKIFFHPGNKPKYRPALYAPTEDCVWRGRVLRGEAHDENTWALGGVAPHAGLFGDIESVSDWGLKLRHAWRGERSPFPRQSTVRLFTGRRIPKARGDWGLGFMKPSSRKASAGRHFSKRSYGHTGFTGTSYWYDPRRDLQVVILSNRVHPTRANARFVSLRPRIHDWVVESLG